MKENIIHNRKTALDKLHLSIENLCNLKQVHGNDVCIAKKGIQEGDAIVSNEKDLVLAVSVADCYPILFFDEKNNVIGAAHAGWRGTCSKIAERTVKEMVKLGAEKPKIKVAIGPGISFQNFEVGAEVIQKFKEEGFPDDCWSQNKIDLVSCNEFVLESSGILKENISKINRCSFEDDFFSYRRDQGVTGRMWGVISM